MKILKRGNTDPKWIGQQFTCTKCSTEVELERGDKVNLNYDQRDGDYYDVECPVCKKAFTFQIKATRG